MRYLLEPEVAGGWGGETIADTSVHPPIVHQLEYLFDGWLGDELLESFPCFVVTKRLAQLIAEAHLTGYHLAELKVGKSQAFLDVHSQVQLPEFVWLQVLGTKEDDFSLDREYRLVVSSHALEVLKQGLLNSCVIEEVA